ncbi:MAG: PRC-barrel domain-containing protein [Nitrosopumilaceae archaeon]|nr:PRC-barrel domain-containing protein [Nitrosopumilaceae archaeon]
MSSELRLKKLRGSGGYVMAKISDEEQMKGNLGGPDLFLAPIGRLDKDRISKYFCNTCEKEFEDSPKIEYENPNEEVAENLMLVEKGQYLCNSCNSSLAEYREFRKTDEAADVGAAKPLDASQTEAQPKSQVTEPKTAPQETQTEQPKPESTHAMTEQSGKISSIEGLAVYDEDAKKIGNAKQVGVDSSQTMVLVVTKNDGTETTIPWNKIKKVGEVILLGSPETQTTTPPVQDKPGKCTSCGFENKEGSKFCEQCGNKL